MHRDTSAFLAIWNDVASDQEAAWLDWHTHEHMPERVCVDGFLVGRRYLALDDTGTRYFTLYEGSDLHVFDGPAYLERLNNPTPWTRRMSPAFRNFARGACQCSARRGRGETGALLAIRLDRAPATTAALDADAVADALTCDAVVTTVAIGVCDHAVTRVETAERSTRSGTADDIFAATILIEALDPRALIACQERIGPIVAAHAPDYRITSSCRYELSYRLSREDVPGA